MDKNAKQMKAAKAREEEAALNKVLCWIAGGSVLEFLLLLLNRYYSHYTVSQIDLRMALETAIKILAVAALVCAGAACYWHRTALKTGKNSRLPGILALFLGGVSVSCFATWFMGEAGLRLSYIGLPVVIVLALIYYLYQREFFVISCLCSGGMLGIWMCSHALGGHFAYVAYLYLVLAAIVAVGGAVVCRKLQAANGALELRGKRYQVFSENTCYVMLYVTAIVNLAALIASVMSIPAMLLMGIVVAWLLVMAVYYTIKMM